MRKCQGDLLWTVQQREFSKEVRWAGADLGSRPPSPDSARWCGRASALLSSCSAYFLRPKKLGRSLSSSCSSRVRSLLSLLGPTAEAANQTRSLFPLSFAWRSTQLFRIARVQRSGKLKCVLLRIRFRAFELIVPYEFLIPQALAYVPIMAAVTFSPFWSQAGLQEVSFFFRNATLAHQFKQQAVVAEIKGKQVS